MATQRRRAAVIAFLGVALTGCGGIVPQQSNPADGTDDGTIDARITSVHLNTDTGNVTMQSRPGATTVTVHRVIHNESNRQIGDPTQTNGAVLTLNGCEPQCSVDYTLVVPPGVTVNGATTEGAITLAAINGIDIGSENGDITIQHVTTGPITLRTENGRIRGTDLASNGVNVQSQNGDIDLAVATPQDISAQSENGTINLIVPNQPYAVSTTKENGQVTINVPNDPSAKYHLDLRIENGEIDVQPSQ